jgi:hypothetical protein
MHRSASPVTDFNVFGRQGISIKDSVEATQEVMEIMKGFRESQGNRDVDG